MMPTALDPELARRVRQQLARSGTPVTPAQVASVLRAETGGVVGDVELLELTRAAQSEFVGAGPLESLLGDPAVTDVLVNAPDAVWVDRGGGLQRTGIRFPDEESVRRLAVRLAAAAGRRLDDAQPWVDATLRDGTRLHAVLPPISAGGTCLSLRVLRMRSFSLAELVCRGSLQPIARGLLEAIVAARLAFLVTGGTGSGKTTLLGSLLGLVDTGERLVLVEDAGELHPDHPHVVRLVARPANVEDAGAVTLRDLVRQALRMRPDRVVVGEVRGAEVVDLLSALNTGHDGGCGTVHANGVEELPARLEALGALGGLSRAALHSQVAAAISVVVHVARDRTGKRHLQEIGVLHRVGERVAVRTAWHRERGDGPAFPDLQRMLAARGVTAGDAA